MTHPRQGAWRNRAPGPWAPGGQGARPGRGNSEAVMLILLSDGAGLTARQCATVLARAGAGLAGAERAGTGRAGWPLCVKVPIGTASAGVRRAGSPEELRQVAADYQRLGAFGPEGVLVQRPVPGPLAMVQAVFARGELV